jgi:hypothetical protein
MSTEAAKKEEAQEKSQLDLRSMMVESFNVALELDEKPGEKKEEKKDEAGSGEKKDDRPGEKKEEKPEPRLISIQLPRSQKAEEKTEKKADEGEQKLFTDDDRKFIESLSEEEREQVELMEFAEANLENYKGTGVAKKTLEGIKKVAELRTKSNDLSEDDLRSEIERALPEIKPSEREKILRAKITHEVEQRVQVSVDQRLREIKEKQAAIELKPKIDEAISILSGAVSGKDAKLPDGVEPLDAELIAKASSGQLERSVDGNIIRMSVEAAKEYVLISNRAVPYSEKNGLHVWLADFVYDQGENMKKAGKVVEGRKFAHRSEYATMTPEERSRHFTFSDQDVLKMIGVNAVVAANAEYRRLEADGFVRKQKVSQNNQSQSAEKRDEQSPKAGVAPVRPASSSATTSESAEFLDRLVPGASKLVSAA